MKPLRIVSGKLNPAVRLIAALMLLPVIAADARGHDIEKAIANHREGEITVVAGMRTEADIEQPGHEIRSCAIADIYKGDNDSLFFIEVMERVLAPMGPTVPVNRRMAEAGRAFLGIPYVASTLETEGDEQLVVNLLEVDCTTFVEYVAAMALTSCGDRTGFGDFRQMLTTLRYRDGVIDGYPSRLHYFTEWLKDNERRGYLTIISDAIGNEQMDNRVGFMTSNPQHYRQLQEEPGYLEAMRIVEKEVSGYEMRYITKEVIDEKAHLIEDGDIIALVTGIGGLDVSHTGLAVFHDGRLHLMHASSRSMEVEITPVLLSEYLQDSRTVTGILVARVNPGF